MRLLWDVQCQLWGNPSFPFWVSWSYVPYAPFPWAPACQALQNLCRPSSLSSSRAGGPPEPPVSLDPAPLIHSCGSLPTHTEGPPRDLWCLALPHWPGGREAVPQPAPTPQCTRPAFPEHSRAHTSRGTPWGPILSTPHRPPHQNVLRGPRGFPALRDPG